MEDAHDNSRLILAIRNRHSGDSWAYFEELRTKTGYHGHVGYIDAYAVGLWAENRSFVAYEVKTARSDFKNDVEKFATKHRLLGNYQTEGQQYAAACQEQQEEEMPSVATDWHNRT